MSSVKISVNQLGDTVQKLLDEYGDDVLYVVEDAVKAVAKDTRKDLKGASPKGDTGTYSKSWSVKTERGRFSTVSTVYSKKPGLPHLLEFPHMMRNGKYSNPQQHIAPINDKAGERLEAEIKERLGRE